MRFYEAAGLLSADRTSSGYRVYGEDAVERLAFIGGAKQLGSSRVPSRCQASQASTPERTCLTDIQGSVRQVRGLGAIARSRQPSRLGSVGVLGTAARQVPRRRVRAQAFGC
ncbi:MerR family transcriptional regulator [Nonomuraea sp. NPDC004186]